MTSLSPSFSDTLKHIFSHSYAEVVGGLGSLPTYLTAPTVSCKIPISLGIIFNVVPYPPTYPDDPSSNPADVYSIFCKVLFEKYENKQETGNGPFKKPQNLSCTRFLFT